MYQIRTDLAIENREIYKNERNKDSRGINVEKEENESYIVTRIKVLNKEGSENLNRPVSYTHLDVYKRQEQRVQFLIWKRFKIVT